MISCAIEEHSLACLLTYLFNYLLTYLLTYYTGVGVQRGGDWSERVLRGQTAVHRAVSDAQQRHIAARRQRQQRPLLVPFPRRLLVRRRGRLRAGAGLRQRGRRDRPLVARHHQGRAVVWHLVRHLWRRVTMTTTTALSSSSSSFARSDFWLCRSLQ